MIFLKRTAVAALVLAAALLLTGCDLDLSAEQLLTAPTLTDQQNELMAALSASLQESVTLCYPSGGLWRTPIQTMDLDGDGSAEAIVCYNVSSTPYASIAVFKRQKNGWLHLGTVEGPGTGIASVEWVEGGYLLVEWQLINRSEHTAILYALAEEGLQSIYETPALRLMIYDIDADGFIEIAAVYARSAGGPFVLRVDRIAESRVLRVGEIALDRGALSCRGITAGGTADGGTAVFVEESTGKGLATEIFVLDPHGLSAAAAGTFQLTQRPNGAPDCRPITKDGVFYVPRRIAAGDGSSSFYEFYVVESGALQYRFTGYVGDGYIITIPEGFETRAYPVTGIEVRHLSLRFHDEAGEEQRLCELKAIYRNSTDDIYINRGYQLVGESDRYSYYMLADYSPETMNTLLHGVYILQ